MGYLTYSPAPMCGRSAPTGLVPNTTSRLSRRPARDLGRAKDPALEAEVDLRRLGGRDIWGGS